MKGEQTLQASETGADGASGGRPGLVLVSTRRGPCCEPIPLDGELVIGREGPGVVVVDDDRASRRHCTIGRDRGGWWIEDLGSRNGTVVDGVRVQGRVSRPSFRVLRVGRCLLVPVDDVDAYAVGVKVEEGVVIGPVQAATRRMLHGLALRCDTLLITGESGSGKELAAQAFHAASGARGRFVAVNCAAIPVGVAERLLFGARKGAFSGAQDSEGYIQSADGGTLFLDEIGELDLEVQGKLLRVLESREVMALGAARPRPVSLRVCLATHQDLRAAVASRRFREDLYFRIGRPELRLPPLRERCEEIPWLVERALRALDPGLVAHASLVEAALLRPWPGNVRELIAELRTAGVHALEDGRDRVRAGDLGTEAGKAFVAAGDEQDRPPKRAFVAAGDEQDRPPKRAFVAAGDEQDRPPKRAFVAAGDEQDRPPSKPGVAGGPAAAGEGLSSHAAIEAALARAGGNLSAAARALGVHRTQLYRWLDRHGLDRHGRARESSD